MNATEHECVVGRCTSVQHGRQLAAAATTRVSEAHLAAYMRWLCGTCGRVTDSSGRTALHLAASCGHRAVVRWLIRRADAGIDIRDVESGYTALHRSIFYGQIHVATDLIKLGANITVRDKDGLTPIDHAMKDRPAILEYDGLSLCEVYVWGTNNNYSLGTGNEQSRSQPELLDMFRKQNISIKQVAMHKFHSVFVSHDGRVFSCGHGQGGRLGLGTEGAALTPCNVRIQNSGSHSPDASALACSMACVGRDHTVLLMENGSVWSCGLNTYHQLGHSPPPPKLLVPRQLAPRCIHAAGDSVVGICATRFHTVIWGQKAVLTFGLHAGQLGHLKGPNPTIIYPKQVSSLTHKPGPIVQVAASDGATVVAVERSITAGGKSSAPGADIYVLHKFKCQKIATRHVGVLQLAVVGGHLDTAMLERDQQNSAGSREEEQQLRVLMLDNKGHLFLWEDNVTKDFIRCGFSLNRSLMVTGITAQTRGQLLLVTRDGEAFEGELKEQRSSVEFTTVKVKRLPHIHRAVAVTSDPKGRNFAVVQTHPIAFLLEVPQMETSDMKKHMLNLLEEASEGDLIHDVVFQVGTIRFLAHRYIIASRCEMLAKRIEDCDKGGIPTVEIKDMRPDIFKQVLQFIYTNHCTFLQIGECPIKVVESDEKANNVCPEDNSVEKILGTRDPSSVSAFEVYSKKNYSNNNKTNNKQKSTTNIHPIRMMQEAAKKFGLSVLITELEKIRYENGRITLKQDCHFSNLKPPVLKRQDHQHLYDTRIRNEEGKELQAHKCILVARLEYFHSMLSGSWVETSGKKESVLSLPVPFNVLEVLIDFLYTDTAPSIQEWEELEFVSNILVVADQLFVTRLKDAAQVALANMLTLRNVGQVLQLSGTYNADQLKQCCFQYISLNLSAVLEARILELVSKNLLQDLTKYYCDFIPAMRYRIVTPYSYAPSQQLMEAVNDAHPILPWDTDDDTRIIDEDFALLKKNLKTTKKKPRARKSSTGENGANSKTLQSTSRARNESVGSNISWGDDIVEDHQDLDMDELIEKPANQSEEDITLMLSENPTSPKEELSWVKIVNNNDKQQRIVQARLKAVSLAREIPIKPTPESFTKLVPLSRQQQGRSVDDTPPNSLPLTSDFPELQGTSPPFHNDHSKMPAHKHSENKKITKLSQKQRKKLLAEQQVGSPPEQSSYKPAQPAWGNMTRTEAAAQQHSFSLLDIMKQEMQQMKGPQSPPSTLIKGPQSPPSHLSTSPGFNPWQKVAENDNKSRKEATGDSLVVSFSDIVADEKKQRENWSRMRAKPLQLTQLEDQAIEDLLVFYNAAGATDEHITVKRVITGTLAPPTWITSHH
ncbi:hypothetical protein L9F63_024751 [Diploptera punctata]|uniref:BTB domain-containing protein n=1 Tax=Diploptera punctata TaxID=6984 RepID=A0AAD7ZFT6_DIPPU|nr:hypothetical protein L9F63_024751 [Diploptera punctata]